MELVISTTLNLILLIFCIKAKTYDMEVYREKLFNSFLGIDAYFWQTSFYGRRSDVCE